MARNTRVLYYRPIACLALLVVVARPPRFVYLVQDQCPLPTVSFVPTLALNIPMCPKTEYAWSPGRRIPWYRQPLKTLYLTFHLGTLFLLLVPFWGIKFVLRSRRPSPTRSWISSIIVNVVRSFLRICTNAGVLQSRGDVTELPSAKQVRRMVGSACKAIWVEPIRGGDVWGEVKEVMVQNNVKPARVAAYWWGDGIADGPVREAGHDEKVLVHFHGGGYVVRRLVRLGQRGLPTAVHLSYQMGSTRPGSFHDTLLLSILKRAQRLSPPPLGRVLNVEYRLTRAVPIAPASINAFPAALLDGVAVVHYLVFSLGFHPRDIILSGDSAGGNVALGVTRYLRDAPMPDPMNGKESTRKMIYETVKSLLPGGMVLFSPWCDIASTHIPERSGPNCSFVRNAATDLVGRSREYFRFTSWPVNFLALTKRNVMVPVAYSEERPYMGMSAYGLRGLSGSALSKTDVAMNPFLSPGSLDIPLEIRRGQKTFADYPPTYVSVGGREIMYDEILLTASRIQGHAAHERIVVPRSSASAAKTVYAWVTVDEEPDMYHDFAALPFAKTEALRTFDRIAQWIAALPPGRDYPV